MFFYSTACTNGLFGQDCSENCNGTCAGCNHVSGVCVTLDVTLAGWATPAIKVLFLLFLWMLIKTRYIYTLYQWYLQVTNYISGKRHNWVFCKKSMFVNCIIWTKIVVWLYSLPRFCFHNFLHFISEIIILLCWSKYHQILRKMSRLSVLKLLFYRFGFQNVRTFAVTFTMK